MSKQLEILLNISGSIILILLPVVSIKTQIFTFQQLDCNISRLGFFWVYAVGVCWSSYEFISVVILWDFLPSPSMFVYHTYYPPLLGYSDTMSMLSILLPHPSKVLETLFMLFIYVSLLIFVTWFSNDFFFCGWDYRLL